VEAFYLKTPTVTKIT